MNKYVFYFLTVVIVSARCCAALSETSDIAVAHSTQADENGKQNTRVNPEATVVSTEERVFPIESIMSSIEVTAESIPHTLHEAKTMDVSVIKEFYPPLATEMEKIGINIDGVVALAKWLSYTHLFRSQFSDNNLQWMVLGKVYFGKDGTTDYGRVSARKLFQEAKIKVVDDDALIKWTTKMSKDFSLESRIILGKVSWLFQHLPGLHVEDAAKMAFGSEYLGKRKLPFSDRIIEIMSEHNDVDEGVYEPLLRLDKDKNLKDLPSDKLLKKAIHEYAADELQKPPAKKRKVA